jgi:hypothetical protein
MPCQSCGGKGWRWECSAIRSCRVCNRFATDYAAQQHVSLLAGGVLDEAYTALEGLVCYNDLDPDLYVGDDDGVLGRLMNRAHNALASVRELRDGEPKEQEENDNG